MAFLGWKKKHHTGKLQPVEAHLEPGCPTREAPRRSFGDSGAFDSRCGLLDKKGFGLYITYIYIMYVYIYIYIYIEIYNKWGPIFCCKTFQWGWLMEIVVVFFGFSAFLASLAFVALWLLQLLVPGLLAFSFCGWCGFFMQNVQNGFRSLLWLYGCIFWISDISSLFATAHPLSM